MSRPGSKSFSAPVNESFLDITNYDLLFQGQLLTRSVTKAIVVMCALKCEAGFSKKRSVWKRLLARLKEQLVRMQLGLPIRERLGILKRDALEWLSAYGCLGRVCPDEE